MRNDVAAAMKNEVAATTSSTSSSMRRSSEQSTTSSTSFNASTKSSLTKSTRIHRHHRHGRIEATAANVATTLPTSTLNSSSTSSCETSLSRSATKKTVSSSMLSSSTSSLLGKETAAAAAQQQQQTEQDEQQPKSKQHEDNVAASSHFNGASTSWVFRTDADSVGCAKQRPFLGTQDTLMLSSPDADVRSLVQGLGSDFAELESMTASSHMMVREQFATRSTNSLKSRLFGTGEANYLTTNCKLEALPSPSESGPDSLELLMSETSCTIKDLKDNPPLNELFSARQQQVAAAGGQQFEISHAPLAITSANEAKIRELMNKARRLESGETTTMDSHGGSSTSLAGSNYQQTKGASESEVISLPSSFVQSTTKRSSLNENAAVKGKIERIDQRMNDLCRKLEDCTDTQKTAELLKIMIQTIEKAWSIPVCGDDLGFKLCSSLRQFGSLDIILRFIHEADARLLLPEEDSNNSGERPVASTKSSSKLQVVAPAPPSHETPQATDQSNITTHQNNSKHQRQLKLNLSKIQQHLDQNELEPLDGRDDEHQAQRQQQHPNQENQQAKDDEDSDILTSDLGLDSTTSMESLSYVSALAIVNSDDANQRKADNTEVETVTEATVAAASAAASEVFQAEEADELRRAREEELVLLSAHLLSQCLTSENRDYIVRYGLDPVIKLACQFTTMKSKHSKRLLKRSALIRRSSKLNQQQQQQNELSKISPNTMRADGENSEEDAATTTTTTNTNTTSPTICDTAGDQHERAPATAQSAGEHQERSDLHSTIGTEILQHLFKHSEETCSRMITLGALQAILYGCRSSHVETLRHCASALANLALYGGPDSQQTMVEQKAHVWLFPLAFNEDDNVQYYACLAIVVLAANQEIEADVLKSSTLDLVEPFVTLHEPRKFAESTTSHIHGQSAAWLRKLMPLLVSKREEARNLACFHFAMEAYIKREQGQTRLFKEIGSIEPLRRAGSSPIAIASKFACQALRLIGEPEPHKLSQQVPLWTCEDVCVWVSQIGFEKFGQAFLESHVDGDLLLQLDEEMLKFDIGISNGIIRRRFLRELSHLKRIADYSSVDKSNFGQLLVNTTSLMLPSCCTMAGHHNQHASGVSIGGGGARGSGGGHQVSARNPNHSLHCCSASSTTGATPGGGGAQQARSARDYLQYIYPIIQLGVTRDNIHLVDCDQLLAECKITNALHRVKLANSIRELQDRVMMEAASQERNSLIGGAEQKTLDVFVSYRRSNGSQLASLLKVHLQLRGFSVFIDVERLEAGKFDNNLLESIRLAKNFILVLSPNALDRCIGDHECKDWIHKEIVAALASDCNIIPIFDNLFHWPDGEQLPEDMRSITYFNGIRWSHDYQDASVDKIERFIRGELNNSSASQTTTTVGGCPFTLSVSSGVGSGSGQQTNTSNQYQRFGPYNSASQAANASTPSIMSSTPSLCVAQNGSNQTHFMTNQTSNGATTSISASATISSAANKSKYETLPDSNEAPEPKHHPLTINYPTGSTLEVNPNVRLR